ncbi:MAG: Nif11-like leader peptide family RiPP precursor [Oscillospiraceae bacterium]
MNTQEFIEKMSKDETLAKKMEGCKSPEEAFEAAKEAGLTDDIDSFKAVMTAVNKRANGELSDEELENIAGGMSSSAKGWLTVAPFLVVGTSLSAAA